MNYQEAGVDIEAAETLVEAIKPMAAATKRPGALGALGGFGALFDPRAAGFNDPIIVTSTDGVGTKLKIAIETGMHDTIGIDLVAMCVNDLICHGAEPLSFLDYFAAAALAPKTAERVIAGIADGCRQAGCVLAGGETAEMPGMYAHGDYDLAGFAVGAAERGTLLPIDVQPGDRLVGLASSGVHSNGFSLVRKIMETRAGLDSPKWLENTTFSNRSYAREFITPTRIYVKTVLALHKQGLLKAAAHITGGGLIGNLPRVLPEGVRAIFDNPWYVPPVFGWFRKEGNVSKDAMLSTFNCGIGMVLVVAAGSLTAALNTILTHGDRPIILGRVEAGEGHHIMLPDDGWWV